MKERFFSDGWRMRALWIGAFGLPLLALDTALRLEATRQTLGDLALPNAVLLLILSAVFANALLRRHRPVLELTDETLRYDSPLRWGRPRCIPLAQIRSARLIGSRLAIRCVSGAGLSLPLTTLRQETRQRACQALAERLKRR